MSIEYQLGRHHFRTLEEGLEKEWLLTNGIGGFANQTIIGANNRIYSGYLIAALNPPVDRVMILSNTHERIRVEGMEYDLVAQEYVGEKREGQRYLNRFELDVLPTYSYQVMDIQIKKTVSLEYGKNTVVICYELIGGMSRAELYVTPLFTFRPSGETARSNELVFEQSIKGQSLYITPQDKNDITIKFYTSEGDYYDRSLIPTSMATPNYLIEENEFYRIDNRNGFLGLDNHYTPYDVRVQLAPYEKKCFYVKCTIEEISPEELETSRDGFTIAKEYKNRIYQLMNRIPFKNDLARKLSWAADAFLVRRDSTGIKTILAGYPWFSDWGRDTMIALVGITLSTRRFDEAREVLESFSLYIKNGLLPNVFPNKEGEEPMYNTIDASLWYFYSVQKYLEYTGKDMDYQYIKEKIYPCLQDIIRAYRQGTKYFIKMDEDGLIQGGGDLDQLTWMDVRVGDLVVTPRHGKSVEVNALWYNALMVMSDLAEHYGDSTIEYIALAQKVRQSFGSAFWNEELGCLYDVISRNDENVIVKDDKIRPNQIYAVSLPYTMLDNEKAKQVVDVVYKYLYTPYGIRSLSPFDSQYKNQYIGKLIKRDLAYHMGTTWGYLMGAFITAYCKVNEHSKEAVLKSKELCEYFGDHMEDGCLNGIAEIFDGEFACTSRGCYTQAWSVGEILRAYTEDVLYYLNESMT